MNKNEGKIKFTTQSYFKSNKTDYNGSFSASLDGISNLTRSRSFGRDVLSHVNAIETKPCDVSIF